MFKVKIGRCWGNKKKDTTKDKKNLLYKVLPQ